MGYGGVVRLRLHTWWRRVGGTGGIREHAGTPPDFDRLGAQHLALLESPARRDAAALCRPHEHEGETYGGGEWYYLNCNAFYDPYRFEILIGAGGDCSGGVTYQNAAVSTIVRHEFGHLFLRTNDDLVQTNCGRAYYRSFDEEIADAFAALSLGTNCVGQGFRGPGCVRDLDNEAKYPAEISTPHAGGKPIAAAFWHLREAMVAQNPANGARDAGILFVLSVQRNAACWDGIWSDLIFVGDTIFASQYNSLIEEALERHKIPMPRS